MHQPLPEDFPPNVIPFKRPVERSLKKHIHTRDHTLEFELTQTALTLSLIDEKGEWIPAPYDYISLSRVELEALRNWLLNDPEVLRLLEKGDTH